MRQKNEGTVKRSLHKLFSSEHGKYPHNNQYHDNNGNNANDSSRFKNSANDRTTAKA
jgi:hypothetical protein